MGNGVGVGVGNGVAVGTNLVAVGVAAGEVGVDGAARQPSPRRSSTRVRRLAVSIEFVYS